MKAEKGALLIITQDNPWESAHSPVCLGDPSPGWWGPSGPPIEPRLHSWALSPGPGLPRSLPLYTGCRCGTHGRAAGHLVRLQPAAGGLRLLPRTDASLGNAGEGLPDARGRPGAFTQRSPPGPRKPSKARPRQELGREVGPWGNRTGGCGGTGVFGNAGESGVGGN